MALGALTLSAKRAKGGSTPVYVDEVSLVGPASYTTGGDTGLRAALRALTGDQREIVDVRPIGLNGGYDVVYNKANDALIVLTVGGAAGSVKAQPAAATDLSAVTFLLAVTSV